MSLRFLAALLVILPGAARAQTRPPMFSPAYVQALHDLLNWPDSDVSRFERQLAANPNADYTRLKLLALLHRTHDTPKRIPHVLWLIEHRPDSEILHSGFIHFAPGELPPSDYQRAVTLWQAAANKNPAILWNAASFFEPLNPELHLHYLEATAAADPNHPFALRPLAHLYARLILDRSPLSPKAQAGLAASNNVWVLANAANFFALHGNAPLAERYFLRAKALDPKLDRDDIIPPPGPPYTPQAFERAAAKIRRLPVTAFPALPRSIASTLAARNCSIPQPAGTTKPVNVIRGRFFAPGESGWAVLCSVNGQSAILAFRNDQDTNPARLAEAPDANYLQGLGEGKIGYSRQIAPVTGAFILRHYRAYGGPKPPPIDHEAIDDAFLGKASVTWYFHNGKWLGLQGAD